MNDLVLPDRQGLMLRVGLYILLAWIGLLLFSVALFPLAGIVVTSTVSTFAAAAVANAVVVRIYERGRLADVGLGWSPSSGREFLTGLAAGVTAVLCVVLVPVALRMATFQPAPAPVEHPWASFAFDGVAIFFGAMGEELLFRGYAFQLLIRSLGPFSTILPTSVIFGLMHSNNPNASALAIVNTVAWGILLGYAVWRTGALWLPIGLHFGWNVALPLLGSNLSGFTMGVTGYTLEWNVGVLWSGGGYGVEGSVLTTGVAVALFFALRKLIPQVEITER
ncbi:MAG: Abortive infection protein [Bryobacterales bacterium]|jgi:membrane protease YdiL (CAAX protease family)|nr:Abortive infection protein [Bryobacterales bacterium]